MILRVIYFASLNLILGLFVGNVKAAPGDPFGLINECQTECEYVALSIGTKLADAFNSYEETVTYYERLHHDLFATIPAFSRLIALEAHRKHIPHFGSSGSVAEVAASSSNRRELNTKEGGHQHGQHRHHSHGHHHFLFSNQSHPFHSLQHQSIYFFGDDTLAPIISTMLLPLFTASQNGEGTDSDHVIRNLCMLNGGDFGDHSMGSLVDGSNVTCNGFGTGGSINFVKSEMLLERNNTVPVINYLSQLTKPPNYVVLQLGYLACLLPFNNSGVDGKVAKDAETYLATFFKDIKDYMKSRTGWEKSTLIAILPSRTFMTDVNSDFCNWRLTRVMAYEAHKQGVIVLEREEIEHRLVFRSERAFEPIKPTKTLLHFPGSQIIASSLISMISCLQSNLTFHL